MGKDVVLYICIQWNIIHPQKRKENPPFATTWINLDSIMLSEISNTEKNQYRISLICRILKSQTVRNGLQNDGYEGLGSGRIGEMLKIQTCN